MQFLQPHFLWGLLGLAIPLFIHLFNFQKTEKVIFSNNRLLMEISMQTRKARQVKNWLLLALRMLALALLILTFAQPVISSFSGSKKAAKGLSQSLVYLDNSASMFVGKDGTAPFDLAQEVAKKWPEKMSSGGWFQLISNDFVFHPWTAARSFSSQVAEVNKPESAHSLKTLLPRLHRQMKNRDLGEKKSILLVSDFQKSTSGQLRNLDWDTSLSYQLLAVEQPVHRNFWIDSVWLPKPIDNQSKSQSIKVKIGSSGPVSDSKVNLQLFAGGSLISGKIVTPGNQNPFITELPFRIKPNELLACTLSTDDAEVTFDNNFFFRIQSPRPARVCLISSGPNPYLSQAFSNKNLFRFSFSPFQSPDYQKIKDADLVVLNQAGKVDDALISALNQIVSDGKSLLLIAGKETHESLLAGFRLDVETNASSQKPVDWKIVLPGTEDAFFANAFREIQSSAIRPFARPAAFLKNGTALLKYENGSPYLSKISRGKGEIFWLASALENVESNVQKHPLVIPMLFRIALSGQQASSGSLFSRVSDDFFYLQPDSVGFVKEQLVTLQSGNTAFKTILSRKGNLIRVDLPSSDLSPGFYQVKSENQWLGMVAMNSGKEESVFDFYTEEEIKTELAAYPKIQVNSIKMNASPAHAGQSAQDSVPLWKYFLIGALLFFFVEMWLARKSLVSNSSPA
jgi:hypothetical protein